jgi:transcriptional regulator with AAA-type ATPase domain/tetratricopeptide (TPR) repeat protein
MIPIPQQPQADQLLARRLNNAAQAIADERIPRALQVLGRITRLHRDPESRFQLTILQAEAFLVGRRFREASRCLEEAATVPSTVEDTELVHLLRAHLLALSGSPREAVHLVIPILQNACALQSRKAKAHWILGLASYRSGHYGWARTFFERSLSYYRESGCHKSTGDILINLALVAKNQGDMSEAMVLLDKAANILPTEWNHKIRFRLLLNRAVCLFRMGDIEGSRNQLKEAKVLASEENEPVFRVMLYNNFGHIYREEKNYPMAEELYSEALILARAESSTRQECLSLEFLGEVYAKQGRLQDALLCLDQAHTIAKTLRQGDLMMEILRRRGEVRSALGDIPRGSEDLKRAIHACQTRGEKREQALAQRAFGFRFARTPEDFTASMRKAMSLLRAVGDRFEFSQTVCLTLEDVRFDPSGEPWLADCVATAADYLSILGLEVWRLRLERLQETLVGSVRVHESPVFVNGIPTKSSLYGLALEASQLAARGREPVLIQGETGAGKEVIAGLVHSWSSRAGGPFIAINCGALPETLVESELFGHIRGSFTGADRDKTGLLEAAAGGTILLDEIADLPSHTQVKLLRFLDTAEIRRLGDTKTRKVDMRVLAATNKDLAALVRQSKFREDLFYRLNVFKITVPSLRERREDILPLAERFLVEAAQGQRPAVLSEEVKDWLVNYDWPGNVRQLRNLCAYLATRAWGKPEATLRDLPADLPILRTGFAQDLTLSAYEREKQDLERAQVTRALRETHGHISKAAKLLGMGRNVLSRRMREIGIDPESFR